MYVPSNNFVYKRLLTFYDYSKILPDSPGSPGKPLEPLGPTGPRGPGNPLPLIIKLQPELDAEGATRQRKKKIQNVDS